MLQLALEFFKFTSIKDGVVFRCSENHLHEDDFHEILVSGDERLTIGKLYILDKSSMKARQSILVHTIYATKLIPVV